VTDPQRLTDEIRDFLLSGQQKPLGELKVLAQGYADACRESNERLVRCEAFLRRGLRSEAVQYADAGPNLLDLLTLLDFPERPEWDQVVAQNHLPAAPALRLDAAAALNRAYAEVAPLEDLLAQHRRLALARAPLGERLAVMRQIALRDTNNPVWDEDVLAFERVRLRDLRGEVDLLRRAPVEPPFDVLERLYHEITDAPWRLPLPADLTGAITQLYARAHHDRLAPKRSELLTALTEALRQKNESLARTAVEEWHVLEPSLQLAADDPLVLRAHEAIAFLARLDGKRAKAAATQDVVRQLAEAIADPAATLDEVDELYDDATKGGTKPLPSHVEGAYQRRVRQAESSKRFWETFALVVALLFGVSILVGFLWFILFGNR